MKRVVRVVCDVEIEIPDGFKISKELYNHQTLTDKKIRSFAELCCANPLLANMQLCYQQASRIVSVKTGRKTKDFVESVQFANNILEKENR